MNLPNRDKYLAAAKANERAMLKLYRYRVYCVKGVELHYRASYSTAETAVEMAKLWANSDFLPHNTYIVFDTTQFKYIEPDEVR